MDYIIWMIIAGLGLVAILFFSKQLKFAFNFLRNAIAGAVGIFACNMLLAPVGIALGINLLTLFIVGVLGLPGFLLLYLSQWMLA